MTGPLSEGATANFEDSEGGDAKEGDGVAGIYDFGEV
jgi:hypothetical protein